MSVRAWSHSASARRLGGWADALFPLLLTLAAFAAVFDGSSYHGVADGLRYFASGESLLDHGHGFNTGVSYQRVATDGFSLGKTYAYPGQLFQLFIGAMPHVFGAPPQVSTMAIANLLPYAGALYAMRSVLRMEMGRHASNAAIMIVALASPSYSDVMLRNATEPWMVFLGLLALRQMLVGGGFSAGAVIGAAYFFRAQIVSTLLGFVLVRRTLRAVALFSLGLGLAYLLLRVVLASLFPSVQETTSAFYLRAFFQKYAFSVEQGWSIVTDNQGEFGILYAMLLAATAMLWACSRFQVTGLARSLVTFFSANTYVMAAFAFYMACTVGEGVHHRYFVLLVGLFWLCLFALANVFLPRLRAGAAAMSTAWPSLVATIVALAVLVTADFAAFQRNLRAEDIPEGFFDGVGRDSVVLVTAGSPLLSLHADSDRIALIPPLDEFSRSKFNRKVDFIFLHAAANRLPADWEAVWNVAEIRDEAGVRFALVSRFDSPMRTSRLFKRVDAGDPAPPPPAGAQ